METQTNLSLNDLIREALEMGSVDSPADVAALITMQLDDAAKVALFESTLRAYVAKVMSNESTRLHVNIGGGKSDGIKRHGASWYKSWSTLRLSTGLPSGGWVKWPEFSLEMAQANIENLDKAIATKIQNKEWFEAIETALTNHGVKTIGELPEEAREELEGIKN